MYRILTLKDSDREKIQRTRDETLALLDACKWDLVASKYSEAMERMEIARKLLKQIRRWARTVP